MTGLQSRVNTWQDETFGDLMTYQGIVRKLHEEICELSEALWRNPATFAEQKVRSLDPAKIAEESADVVIVLMGLAKNQGFDLLEEVERKLETNKARAWEGTSHVKGTTN